MYREFWWASAMTRMDTRDSLATVVERGVHGRRTVVPPEEVTTFNLVRRLAFWHARQGANYVALHSRPLEGGNVSTGRPPSGADLELSVETAPGVWVDLALQAKKLNPSTGRYDGWNQTQNNSLRRWASNHGNRTPGMLLYNCDTPPFGSPGTTGIAMGACCSSPLRCHGWRWPNWALPDHRTPVAVALVILDPYGTTPALNAPASLTDPTPAQVLPWMQPLECLFCPRPTSGSNPTPVPLSDHPPQWAKALLEAPRVEEADATSSRLDAEGLSDLAAFSLALPYLVAGQANDRTNRRG